MNIIIHISKDGIVLFLPAAYLSKNRI